MTLKIDVLPAPLRPMMPHRSPSATVKVTFLNSSVAPKETPTLEQERRVTRRCWKTRKEASPQAGTVLRNAERWRKAKRLPRPCRRSSVDEEVGRDVQEIAQRPDLLDGEPALPGEELRHARLASHRVPEIRTRQAALLEHELDDTPR